MSRIFRFLPGFIAAAIVLGCLSADAADKAGVVESDEVRSRQIGCVLWEILSFTRADGGKPGIRTTGSISLGPGRNARIEIKDAPPASTRPDNIHLFYSSVGTDGHEITEEIRDAGLDGLNPDQPGDAYNRRQGPSRPVDLLSGIAPEILPSLNREYMALLREMLAVLERRTAVHGPVAWTGLAPGLEMARPTVFRYIRYGDNRILLLRIDPARWDLAPMHYRELSLDQPPDPDGWAERLPRAAALFNAGQYYPDYRYIGLFMKEGMELGTGRHPDWKALLLSGGPEEAPTTIRDLQSAPFDPEQSTYRYVMQSFMLLDASGRSRVRGSESLASRTAIAQDRQDRIIVVLVTGACTLHELALLLRQSSLGVRQAMSLDGGFETQAVIRTDSGSVHASGAWVVNDKRQVYAPNVLLPLPAVVAVTPR